MASQVQPEGTGDGWGQGESGQYYIHLWLLPPSSPQCSQSLQPVTAPPGPSHTPAPRWECRTRGVSDMLMALAGRNGESLGVKADELLTWGA